MDVQVDILVIHTPLRRSGPITRPGQHRKLLFAALYIQPASSIIGAVQDRLRWAGDTINRGAKINVTDYGQRY